MSIWTLELPGYHPTPLNQLLGRHHFARGRLKKQDAEVIGRAVLLYGVPPAAGKRTVRLHLVFGPGERGCDPDAYWKTLLDALVQAGALKDDTRNYVLTPAPPEYSRGESRKSYVTIEEGP